jgi:hypothetical protein
MSIDVELDRWRRQWQGGPESATQAGAAEALRRRVLRDTRRIWLGLIAPILVTVGIGGWIALRALRSGQMVDVVLAVEGWLFIVVVWVGSLWIGRGTWRPLADTTAAFIDVSIRRGKANLRGVSFGAYLYVLQLLFIVLVMVFSSPVGLVAVLTSPSTVLIGWLGLPLFLAWMLWFRRRQRARLEYLHGLRRQLLDR